MLSRALKKQAQYQEDQLWWNLWWSEGIEQQDLTSTSKVSFASNLFTSDGRLGLPGTLHRIARGTYDRDGRFFNITYRVGRHQQGIAEIFLDLLAEMCAPPDESLSMNSVSRSLLLVGPPGAGKTTLLRDITRLLADDFNKAVSICDTSNEIAGDYDVPHSCIGSARRFSLSDRRRQDQTLVEMVQNHGPQVVVVDEIGTKKEVEVIKDIAQRGVLCVGTAHGVSIDNLIANTELSGLIGGTGSSTVGDVLALNSQGGQKFKIERSKLPPFGILIEVLGDNRWRVHRDVARSVDGLLRAQSARSVKRPVLGTEIRSYDRAGRMVIEFEDTDEPLN